MYKALPHAVRTNSGIGFHNNDQGHPVYRVGARGKEFDHIGDSPADNVMFHLLRALYPECGPEDLVHRSRQKIHLPMALHAGVLGSSRTRPWRGESSERVCALADWRDVRRYVCGWCAAFQPWLGADPLRREKLQQVDALP